MKTKPLLLSLKPCYAELVFQGLKRAELRRRIPCVENRDVFIYVSSPVRCLRGGFRVEHVWSGSPEEVWKEVEGLARVERREFDAYYEGRSIAYALRISEVWEYDEHVHLEVLRKQLSDFVVPQSWRYVKPDESRYFQTLGWSPIHRRVGSPTRGGGNWVPGGRRGHGGERERDGGTKRAARV